MTQSPQASELSSPLRGSSVVAGVVCDQPEIDGLLHFQRQTSLEPGYLKGLPVIAAPVSIQSLESTRSGLHLSELLYPLAGVQVLGCLNDGSAINGATLNVCRFCVSKNWIKLSVCWNSLPAATFNEVLLALSNDDSDFDDDE